jgi:hypothetical protein
MSAVYSLDNRNLRYGASYLSASEFLISNIYIPLQIDTLCIKAGVAACCNNQRSYVRGEMWKGTV